VLTFRLVGAVDGGGLKKIGCATYEVGPVEPTVTWTITLPSGETVGGEGTVAAVEVNEIGMYTCVFSVSAERECAPGPVSVGPAVTQPPSNYSTVEIVYKTFIASEIVATIGWNPLLYDYVGGDARWFAQAGSSRTYQSTRATVDPRILNGQVGFPAQFFGTTNGFNDSPTGSDVYPCLHCSGPYGHWCLAPGATVDCSGTPISGQNGNVLAVLPLPRVSESEIAVKLIVVGYLGCGSGAPAIDVRLTLHIRQRCQAGILLPMEFRGLGQHDGFPWHELFLNGVNVYYHDPCCTGETPNDLFGSGDRFYDVDEATPCDDDVNLGPWQPVP
jgi:hypothetical protein